MLAAAGRPDRPPGYVLDPDPHARPRSRSSGRQDSRDLRPPPTRRPADHERAAQRDRRHERDRADPRPVGAECIAGGAEDHRQEEPAEAAGGADQAGQHSDPLAVAQPDELEHGDEMKVMANEKGFREVSKKPRRRWRHRNEVQEDVRTEDDENKPEQNSRNNGGDFHGSTVA